MRQNNKTTLWVIIGLVVLFFLGYWIYASQNQPDDEVSFVSNFEECVDAGYPVQESYPRQCSTPDGNVYVEDLGDGTVAGESTEATDDFDLDNLSK
jgi:hypothetical protein